MNLRLAAVLLCAAVAAAQPPDTFEVASIKLADASVPHTMFSIQPGGSVRIEGASLKSLIEYAYDLREFQLSGATGWMTSERYTVVAKGTLDEGPADEVTITFVVGDRRTRLLDGRNLLQQAARALAGCSEHADADYCH